MKFSQLLFIVFLFIVVCGTAQELRLSPAAQISVLTCGPGEELYSTFGHSAIRVQDPTLGIDQVYNYGTFDFNTPNFYLKFTRGKLLYALSTQSFPRFLYSYQLENRWVKEQLLDLSIAQKQELFRFLRTNNLPENRFYKYDFFFDNCSSRIRDGFNDIFKEDLQFNEDHLKEQYTFRELIHQNLITNSWSSFGIDLALGAVIDRKATQSEHMFLPFYVLQQLENSTLSGKPLVMRERTILESQKISSGVYFLASPLFWFLLFLLFVLTITFIDFKNGLRNRFLDLFLFSITGIAGFIILLLWFATDHSATASNFNVLWLFPTNLVVAYFMMRKKQAPAWMDKYLLFCLIGLGITLIFWIFRIQVFSPLIIPLLVLLGVRYTFLYRWYKLLKAA